MEAKVAALAKDKARAEHKLNQLNSKLAKLTTELKDERHMNESLRQNQMSWQVKMTELEKKFVQKDGEVKELQVSYVIDWLVLLDLLNDSKFLLSQIKFWSKRRIKWLQ